MLSLTDHRFAIVIPEPKTPECIFSFPRFPTSANFSKCCCGGDLVTKSYPNLATPWTVSCQAPLSTGLCRHEYWSGLPSPSPGDLLDPGIEPGSPALQTDFFYRPARFFFNRLSYEGSSVSEFKCFKSTNWFKWLQMISAVFDGILVQLKQWYCGCFHFKHTTFLAV